MQPLRTGVTVDYQIYCTPLLLQQQTTGSAQPFNVIKYNTSHEIVLDLCRKQLDIAIVETSSAVSAIINSEMTTSPLQNHCEQEQSEALANGFSDETSKVRVICPFVTRMEWGVFGYDRIEFANLSRINNLSFAVNDASSESAFMSRKYSCNKKIVDPIYVTNSFRAKNIASMAKQVQGSEAQVFITEKYIGSMFSEFVELDSFRNHWPAMVILIREDLALENPQMIEQALTEIYNAYSYCKHHVEDTVQFIVSEFNMSVSEAAQFLSLVSWDINDPIQTSEIDQLLNELLTFRSITQRVAHDQIIIDRDSLRDSTKMSHDQLRQMKLYSDSKVNQILYEAVMVAYDKGDKLTPLDFQHFDNLHYQGTTELEKFLNGIFSTDKQYSVVDVCAGVGGPSRWLAWKYPSIVKDVRCIEYLPELCKAGSVLNRLTKLDDRNSFICADICTVDLKEKRLFGSFNLLISQLGFLHIANKVALYSQLSDLLTTDASFYIEDYFICDGYQFDEKESDLLIHEVSVPKAKLPTKQEYLKHLSDNNLSVDRWKDKTSEWTVFVWDRYEAFLSNAQLSELKHGEQYVTELNRFYRSICLLFHWFDDLSTYSKYKRVMASLGDSFIPHSRPQILGGVCIIGHKEC